MFKINIVIFVTLVVFLGISSADDILSSFSFKSQQISFSDFLFSTNHKVID